MHEYEMKGSDTHWYFLLYVVAGFAVAFIVFSLYGIIFQSQITDKYYVEYKTNDMSGYKVISPYRVMREVDWRQDIVVAGFDTLEEAVSFVSSLPKKENKEVVESKDIKNEKVSNN